MHHGAVWQWLTYAWVHWLGDPVWGPILFVIEMALLYSFGREVEKYVGWRKYLGLYAVLLVAPPAVLTLLGLVIPDMQQGELWGSGNLNFAVFVAFATLYPAAEIFFRIQARIVAWALVGVFSLMHLSGRDWPQLCMLLVSAGAAWFFINWVRDTLPEFQLFRGRSPRDLPAPRVSPRPRSRPAPPPREDPVAEIDPLLDKIARQGINSLTAQEREMLERVREKLLKQPKA